MVSAFKDKWKMAKKDNVQEEGTWLTRIVPVFT